MADLGNQKIVRHMSSPRAMAVGGVLFAVLFATSLALMRSVFPEVLTSDLNWDETGATRVTIAITIMPFAGIAFLYFLGVLRDTFGEAEDKIFSSVFLGSGILFVAMAFVAAGLAGAILATIEADLSDDGSVVAFGRAAMLQISNVYALRMAGVFMISLGTLWLRTGALPKWVSYVTYAVALVLLFVVSLSLWVTLVFPGWALAISVYLLIRNYRMGPTPGSVGSEVTNPR